MNNTKNPFFHHLFIHFVPVFSRNKPGKKGISLFFPDTKDQGFFLFFSLQNVIENTNKNAIENRDRYEQDGLAVYPKEEEAEILNTWKLPLRDRVIIHIKLLRLLRKGFSIKEALFNVYK